MNLVHLIPWSRGRALEVKVPVTTSELRSKDLINLEAMHRIKADYLEVMIMSTGL